ncbi:MAG: redoxin domain-containing protein, partial [Lentisphaeria bacterium]
MVPLGLLRCNVLPSRVILYSAIDVNIVGASKDSIKAQKKFAEKNNLTFPLLADTEGDLCEKF